MVSDDHGVDRDYGKKSNRTYIELAIVVVLAIVVIAAVVLSIIVLVRLNDASSSSCSPSLTTTVNPGTTTTAQSGTNIPTLPPISSNDNRYNAYVDAVNQLKIAINPSIDPCNDFWGYACGNYPSTMGISFGVVDANNFLIQGNQIMNSTYQQPNTPRPLQQTVWFFNKCVDARTNFSAITQGGTIVINALRAFQTATGLPFPMLNQNTQLTDWPSATVLGTALGYMSGVAGENTLISSFVDTNWVAPQSGATPYYLFIDQSSLIYSNSFYVPGTWELFQAGFIGEAQSVMNELASLMGVTLDANTLNSDITDLINLELALARNFSTDDTTRRQFLRSYNPTTVTQAQSSYPFIDWSAYFTQLSTGARSNVKGIMNSPGFTFSVIETAMLSKLSQSLVAGNTYGFTPRQLVNYLTYRLVLGQAGFLPSAARSLNREKLYRQPLGKPRYIRTPEPIDPELFENKALTPVQMRCTEETLGLLTYANARFFVDALYPDKGVSIRQTAGAVITSILSGFQSMIDQLPWMDATSKVSAYGKVTNLVQNIAFPDFIIDDNQLTQYYSELNIAQGDDYVTMLNKINAFDTLTQWDYLARTSSANRYDFNGAPGIVNAWYQPEINSITFPAGILQPPYFHPDYPVSLNYGGLGVVAGHELTHGFDDQGVQWTGNGTLAPWMSDPSKQGFQRLANCVINEYNGFCPLPAANYTPNCVKGTQTQGENIADNGGIHAAWRAYKTYVSVNGPDPLLPDPVLGQFTHDQLFFLGFSRVWCEKRSDAGLFRQLLLDPHSPSQYRVFGTIQNIPAFQNAFNCPSGSNYAPGPNKHCNVWVLDNN